MPKVQDSPERMQVDYYAFSNERRPVPIAASMPQLEDVVDVRVRPGLDALRNGIEPRSTVEYAGYALIQLEERTMPNRLRGRPLADEQDFYLNRSHCLDVQARYGRDPLLSMEDSGTLLRYFRQSSHILGPVVRLDLGPPAPLDEYGQRPELVFSTRHAVCVPGTVLTDALIEARPMFRNRRTIPRWVFYDYVGRAFGLAPE
jgi:hypothetical protein